MRRPPLRLFLAAGGLLLLTVVAWFLTHRPPPPPVAPSVSSGSSPSAPPSRSVSSLNLVPDNPAAADTLDLSPANAATAADLAQKLSAHLTHPATRPHEAVLLFKTADGYHRFLARAAESGVIVLGQIDPLHIVRVRVRAYDRFAAELVARASDYGGVGANTYVVLPPPPAPRDTRPLFAVGDSLLATLGVPAGADTSTWGRGVTLAILDGGAFPHPALGARLRYLDIGLGYAGTGAAGSHGTAVASLAAGSSPAAPGLAPAADILSIRVVDTDDKSDAFTVTRGIVAAVDSGAHVINLSLGGYSTSKALDRAIAYASDRGVVIVASAGNNGASRLTWPAADPRVVSVGATDASGSRAPFSNSGEHLHLTAPGVGLRASSPDNDSTLFSGTSASAPVVTGAIAVVMSESPGLTATQAAELLRAHAADGGPAGPDPDYGHGTLDLGRVLARHDRSRIDTAVSAHHYNAETASLEIVLQNRGALPSDRLTLVIEFNGHRSTQPVPLLEPGHSLAVALPLDATAAAGPITLRSHLANPDGTVDAVPANNTRASVFDLTGR